MSGKQNEMKQSDAARIQAAQAKGGGDMGMMILQFSTSLYTDCIGLHDVAPPTSFLKYRRPLASSVGS